MRVNTLYTAIIHQLLTEGKKSKQQQPVQQQEAPTWKHVTFIKMDCYDEAFKRYDKGQQTTMTNKLTTFMQQKATLAQPTGQNLPFGKTDTSLWRSKYADLDLFHYGIGNDARLMYNLLRNPETNTLVFQVYGIWNHDDLGIGQPINVRKQEQMATRLKSARPTNTVLYSVSK